MYKIKIPMAFATITFPTTIFFSFFYAFHIEIRNSIDTRYKKHSKLNKKSSKFEIKWIKK